MIRPCSCRDFVHRSCLDRWRAVSPNPASFVQCDVCNSEYVLETVDLQGKCCSPMSKFVASVVFQVLVIAALCNGFVFLIAWVIVPAVDSSGWRNQWFPASWNHWGIDYVSGLIVFFALIGVLGICVMIIRCMASACHGCCQCCYHGTEGYRRSYRYNTYPYYGGGDFFLWFWICYPIPTPHHMNYHHGCANACLGCNGCSGCDCQVFCHLCFALV